MTQRPVFIVSCLLIFLMLPLSPLFAGTYRVRSGDNLYDISKKHGISIHTLKKANQLQTNSIRPGQILTLPDSAANTAKPVTPLSDAFYIVKKGDTLASISRKTGASVKDLSALNSVNPRSLRIGQKVLLPKPVGSELATEDLLDEEGDPSAPDEAILDETCPVSSHEAYLGNWRDNEERKLLVKVATGFLGAPYKLGGASVKGIDCSAFVRKMYAFFDITLPRTAREQAFVGVRVNRDELAEGDLVFFRTRKPIGHVGIYIGNNEFVHASYKAKSVRIDRLDHPYFQQRYLHAVRVKQIDAADGV